MAGEWIPVDIGIGTKPEVLELAEITGEPVAEIVFRMVQLWGWFSLNSADGTAAITPRRIAAICGGDESFWLAVESVGWIKFGKKNATVPKWDERFSKAAKARAQTNRRVAKHRIGKKPGKNGGCNGGVTVERYKSNGDALPPGNGGVTMGRIPEDRTGEEKREETHTQAAGDFWGPFDRGESEPGWAATAWADFANRWNATERANPWRQLTAPDGWVDYAGRPGWLERANDAMARLPGCKFFSEPVAVTRFFGYVDRILAGEFDHEKTTSRPRRENRGVRL